MDQKTEAELRHRISLLAKTVSDQRSQFAVYHNVLTELGVPRDPCGEWHHGPGAKCDVECRLECMLEDLRQAQAYTGSGL